MTDVATIAGSEYSPHPTPQRIDVVYDCGRAGRVALPLYYVTSDAELAHVDTWLSSLRRTLLDTETGGLDPLTDQIATIQFGYPVGPNKRAYVIDVRCLSPQVLQAFLWKHMPNRELKKLGMNIGFECRFITGNFKVPVRGVECIQLAEQVMRAGLFGAADDANDGGTESERLSRKQRAAYTHTSMAKLAKFYLGIELDKDHALRTSFFSTPPGKHDLRQLKYAAGDVVYPYFIMKDQAKELEARDLLPTVQVEWEVVPALAEAELRGILMNQDAWRELWQKAVTKLDEVEHKLDRLVRAVQSDLFGGELDSVRPLYHGGKRPVPLNYGSPDHVKWLIKYYCRSIGWPVEVITDMRELQRAKRKEGQGWLDTQRARGRTVEEKDIPDYVLEESKYLVLLKAERPNLIIAKCLGQLPADLVDLLGEASVYRKLASTYGLKFLQQYVRADTGRFHTQFHAMTTTTGRIATEPNVQNIPGIPAYRQCFIPSPGKKFVIADYSQVEPRITALVSGDTIYTKTFLTKDDIYLAVAEGQLGERPDKKTEAGALMRQRYKQMVLSLAYRMGKAAFRRKMILALAKEIMEGKVQPPTFHEISEMYDQFFRVHEKIKEYQEEMTSLASPQIRKYDDTGSYELVDNPRRIWDSWLGAPVTWIEAPCGRKRFFRPDANPYAEAPNVPPQSGSATMIKAAIGLIQLEIDKRGWWHKAGLSNTVHDELVYEVDEDIAVEFAVLLKERMEYAGNFYSGHIPIVAEWPEGSIGVVSYWTKKASGDDLMEEAA